MAVVKFSPYNPNTAKPVESILFPCLDEGSTPSSSTGFKKKTALQMSVARFFNFQTSSDVENDVGFYFDS